MAGRNRRGRLDLSTRFVLSSLRLREGVARFYPLLFNTFRSTECCVDT